MFKVFVFGFLAGIILIGICWFVVGRIRLGEISSAVKRADGDYIRVERLISELGDNINGFADDIAIIRRESNESFNGIGDSIIRVGDIDIRIDNSLGELKLIKDDIGYIVSRVDQLEEWNRASVTGIGRLTTIAYEYRRLSEKSKTE